MLNHIIIMGRLVADPEMRTTPNGVPVTTVRIACDRDFKNKQTGEKETDFIDVVAWRTEAEFVSKYFAKGRMAVVEGRLQIRNYTDRDGNKRTASEIVADHFYFGDSKRDGESGGSFSQIPRSAPQAPAQSGGYAAPSGGDDQFAELTGDDGDLPF